MTAMLDVDGLRHIANGQNMISYCKGASPEFSPMLAEIQPYIDSNHLYIRLASSDMFSASKPVVQKMISGEYPDARSAFDSFNAAMLTEENSGEVVAHISEGYDYSFDADKGNPAAAGIADYTVSDKAFKQTIADRLALGGQFAEPTDYITLK